MIIAVQDIILEYILSKGWKDYENFARELSERVLSKKTTEKQALEAAVSSFHHSFYGFNCVSRARFVKNFPTDLIAYRLSNLPQTASVVKNVAPIQSKPSEKRSNVTINEVFPEIENVDIETGKQLALTSLDIYERVVQNALRDALREKNATNIGERMSDGSLEVADIEDFTIKLNGKSKSFSAVVKGYKSINHATIVFEDIAHQVFKANDTHPNHILLVLAKPFADTVVTNLVKYGKDCGNRNLVILMDNVTLARFLRARKII